MADKREFIKLDIGYLSNPKIAGLLLARRPLAVLLHVECMTYARQHRTDGVVPAALALRAVIGATKRDLDAAVAAGLLVDLGDGTVDVHDYAEHQETREQIESRSDAARGAANARWKGRARRSGPDDAERSTSGNADRIAESNAEERRGEENKNTRPTAPSESPRPKAAEPERFADFWAVYPRREDKGHARTAYARAIKSADPQDVITGAKRYAESTRGTERRYIALPATWLNGERWTDETATSPAAQASPWDRPSVTDRRLAGEL